MKGDKSSTSVSDTFITTWQKFQNSHNLDTSLEMPGKAYMNFNLPKLFAEVQSHGGSAGVAEQKKWTAVGLALHPNKNKSSVGYQAKQFYFAKFERFEKAYLAGEVGPIDIETIRSVSTPPGSDKKGSSVPKDKPAKDEKPASPRLDSQKKQTPSPSSSDGDASEAPENTDFEDLVNHRVGIFSQDKGLYVFGTITDFLPEERHHSILYDNASTVTLDLKQETWILIDKPTSETTPAVDQLVTSPAKRKAKDRVPHSKTKKPKTENQESSKTCPSDAVDADSKPSQSVITLREAAESCKIYPTIAGPAGYEIYISLPGCDPKDLKVNATEEGLVNISTAKVADPLGAQNMNMDPSAFDGDKKQQGDVVKNEEAPAVHGSSMTVDLETKIDTSAIKAVFARQDQQLYVRIQTVE